MSNTTTRWGRAAVRSVVLAVIALTAVVGLAACEEQPSTNQGVETGNQVVETPVGSVAAKENPTVPRVIGLDLQTAQDTLQAAGFKHLDSVDNTGRGRSQVIDSNWVVVSQLPRAGESVSTAYKIILFVVKYGEQ